MTDKEIIDAAKAYEKSTVFGDIVLKAKGVNSSSGIGFLEGAVWMRQQMIDKACEWWKNEFTYPSMTDAENEWYREKIEDFRKAME